jgi:hypothetical protein
MNTIDPHVNNAVRVLINDNPVWLDTENLRDDSLCLRAPGGSYETETGEQHFTWENAMKAAEKQGKRLLTRDEQVFIASLPRCWNNEKKEMLFIFDLADGGTTDVFFPAAGFRYHPDWALTDIGVCGAYWSAAFIVTNAYHMDFDNDAIYPSYNSAHAYGLSVRCVRNTLNRK